MARKKRVARKARLPRTTKVSKTQTGRSNTAADKKRTAMKPGRRLSKSGKVYFENRRNRSDKDSKRRL